ncbi:MAG: hypothetical protein JWL59_4819 [Chthoniobacteraceae bacterium]|nr:hypothetical protein [Chthoniobacteraceae bacterium]
MAGEQKGKAYEAFTKVALEQVNASGSLKGEIFWDKRPDQMTIVPDLTIGKDKDHPDVVLLINHSGSAGDSHKKFWRNLGEVVEAKVFLPKAPRAYAIVFDAVMKEDLKKAQLSYTDGQLIVGDLKYGSELQAWIDEHLGEFPKDKAEKVGFFKARVRRDTALKELVDKFAKDLTALLRKRAPKELESIWLTERSRKPGKAPTAQMTSVRRGLSKLLIFEDTEVALRLFTGKRVRQDEVPDYAFELGLSGKALGRASPSDQEIADAVTLLGTDRVRAVIARAPLAAMERCLIPLRNLPNLTVMGKYLTTQFNELCDAEVHLKRLIDLHANPLGLVAGYTVPTSWPPASVWLIEFVIEIVKASTGVANGYGYAQLAREVLAAGFGNATDLKSANQFGGGFGLSAWISRDPKSGFRSDLLKGCAHVLSKRLATIGKSQCEKLIVAIKTQIADHLIEAKLCTYKGFEPLAALIESQLKSFQRQSYRSCFGEWAQLGGQATKTTVIRIQHTVINWQSCSDAGRDHKKKELCGRAAALRYSWDAVKKCFVPRPGVKKLALVVDGTWRQGDLDALARAGWDEIFYPNQMEELEKAII